MIFKNIYYDSWKNKMHLWELEDDGKTSYKTFDHEIEYYTLDKTGKSEIKSIFGEPVSRHVTKNKNALKELKESGERLFESDLDETIKFLHKRYGDNQTKVNFDDYVIANFDIEIQTEGEFPKPELALYPINLITVQFMRTKEMFTFGLYEYTGDNKDTTYIHCKSEEALITNFCKFLKFKKVDMFVTWNGTGKVGGFDIPYIVNRIERLNLKCTLSPVDKVIRKYNGDIEIVGVSDLDLMELYKKFTYQNQPSFSLDYIGNLECGEGKMTFEGSISDLWRTDPNKFIDYNIQDVLLVGKIESKKKLVELAINFSIMTRTPLSKVYSTVAIVEGYLLRYLHKENLVMCDRSPLTSDEKIKGGYVEAHPGFYKYLIAIDGTSLYPSTLRQFNISPETKVLNPESTEGLIKTRIKGLYYKKEQGIIPKVVTEIFNNRKMLKEKMQEYELQGDKELTEYYDSQQLIFKILANSVYGAFLEKSFHYYDNDNGSCITSIGRDVIRYVAKNTNKFLNEDFPKIAKNYYPNFNNNITNKNKVVVVDTDSIVGDSIINTDIGNISIEDIFNKFSYNVVENGFENYVANVKDLYSISFNTNEEKVEQKKIKYIKKHKVQKRMYKIVHENDSVIVTEDHSIIVERNGLYIEISPRDIIDGDKIIKL